MGDFGINVGVDEFNEAASQRTGGNGSRGRRGSGGRQNSSGRIGRGRGRGGGGGGGFDDNRSVGSSSTHRSNRSIRSRGRGGRGRGRGGGRGGMSQRNAGFTPQSSNHDFGAIPNDGGAGARQQEMANSLAGRSSVRKIGSNLSEKLGGSIGRRASSEGRAAGSSAGSRKSRKSSRRRSVDNASTKGGFVDFNEVASQASEAGSVKSDASEVSVPDKPEQWFTKLDWGPIGWTYVVVQFLAASVGFIALAQSFTTAEPDYNWPRLINLMVVALLGVVHFAALADKLVAKELIELLHWFFTSAGDFGLIIGIWKLTEPQIWEIAFGGAGLLSMIIRTVFIVTTPSYNPLCRRNPRSKLLTEAVTFGVAYAAVLALGIVDMIST